MLSHKKEPLPTIDQCIKYMDDLGWKIVVRSRGWYVFRKDGVMAHLTPMHWTLGELRHAIRYGF